MAAILFTEDGNTRIRRFDEIVVIGRNGQVRRVVKNPDSLVLTQVGNSRKLISLPWSKQKESDHSGFWLGFGLLTGVWLNEVIRALW